MADPNTEYNKFKKKAKSKKDLAIIELAEKMAKRKKTSPAQTFGTIKTQKRFDKNKISKKTDMIGDDNLSTDFQKGGRVGYKMGSKCKLAMKGKGRAYGKNS
jgi:hypothetical protein